MSENYADKISLMGIAELQQHLGWIKDALSWDRQGLVEVMVNTRRITLAIEDKEARIAAIEKRIKQLTQDK